MVAEAGNGSLSLSLSLFCFSSFSSLLLLLLLLLFRPLSSLLFYLGSSPFCLLSFFFSSSPVFIGEKQGGDVMVVAGVLPPVQHVESGRQVVSLFRRLFEQKKERN